MRRPFVVMSGLPGSGKTTLGRRLATALALPLVDKDEILERLFETKGVGDAGWRRTLSRESDAILEHDATMADGAVVASFWRLPGVPADSGTPTEWLKAAPNPVVNVHCVCPPEIAARRFLQRQRHPGHLDGGRSYADILESVCALERLPPLGVAPRIDVDTSYEPELDPIVGAVQAILASSVPDRD